VHTQTHGLRYRDHRRTPAGEVVLEIKGKKRSESAASQMPKPVGREHEHSHST
jgi:hypothetical protein